MYTYKIEKIKKIVDGDTIDVSIDLGFGVTINHRIRLKDIDAAETRTLDLQEKKEGLIAEKWLEDKLAEPGEFIIKTTKEDRYGRMLGVIYKVGDPVTINERMINENIARPYIP